MFKIELSDVYLSHWVWCFDSWPPSNSSNFKSKLNMLLTWLYTVGVVFINLSWTMTFLSLIDCKRGSPSLDLKKNQFFCYDESCCSLTLSGVYYCNFYWRFCCYGIYFLFCLSNLVLWLILVGHPQKVWWLVVTRHKVHILLINVSTNKNSSL